MSRPGTATAAPRPRPSAARPPASAAYLPALDGLRAFAIIAVIAYHYGHLGGGFLGVDLFFVLSGFLITRVLLLKRADTGSFGLGWFWLRRARRLFPAVLVLLAVVAVWVHYIGSPSLSRLTAGQTRTSLVYGSNWYNIFVHLQYTDVGIDQTPLNHLWSLAIEEQFYLIWPLLALLFLRRWFRPRVFGALALVLAVASYVIAPLVLDRAGLNAAYLGTETRAGAILLGCAVSLLTWKFAAARRPAPLRSSRRMMVDGVALVAAAALGYCWVRAHLDAGLFHGVLAVCGVAAAVLILCVLVNPAGWTTRLLGLAPLTYLGKRSYSLYLWHFPVLILVSEQRTTFHGTQLLVIRLALTVLATEISYRLVENPIRRSGLRAVRLVPALLVAALAVGGLSTLAPVKAAAGPVAISSRVGGALPAAAADLRLMVVGDSWGRHTVTGFGRMAPPRPAQVYSEAEGSCGIADPTREISSYDGIFSPSASCLAWPTRWKRTLRQDKPDAVIAVLGNWDEAPQEFDHSGKFVTACDPSYRARYSGKLDQALTLLTSTGAPVYMTNVITLTGKDAATADCMNTLLEAAAARNAGKGVHLLDLRSLLCPGGKNPAFIDGKRVYDETGHLYIDTQVNVNAWQLRTILSTTKPSVANAPVLNALQIALRDAVRRSAASRLPGLTALAPPSARADQFVELTPALVRASAPTDSRTLVLSRKGRNVGTVAAFEFATDFPADALATAVQAALVKHHAKVTSDTYNLKYFQVTNAGRPKQTIGMLRTTNHVVYIVLNGAGVTTVAAERQFLTAAAPGIGG